MKAIKAIGVLLAVFSPFLLVGYALAIVPNTMGVLTSIGPIDWVWLIMLGLMMVGLYYVLAVYLEDEDLIEKDFMQLDLDHDGYISRQDASSWKRLARAFDQFDTDHDGLMSRAEFEAFEHSAAH